MVRRSGSLMTTTSDHAAANSPARALDHEEPTTAESAGVTALATRTEALLMDRERYVPRGVFAYHPVFPASGSGAHITDVDGKEYIDFAGGIGTMNVGHSHPRVVAAIREQ